MTCHESRSVPAVRITRRVRTFPHAVRTQHANKIGVSLEFLQLWTGGFPFFRYAAKLAASLW